MSKDLDEAMCLFTGALALILPSQSRVEGSRELCGDASFVVSLKRFTVQVCDIKTDIN